ncbi:DUF4197 domain-containing protein [Sulfurospirillum arcachonense]|uniref:DUF4197 domain-containing protein n=1 Tax=Sulfurospirillum arcachonense TaxID=57666 RepID=UPI000469A962|nr:DUF4197 domain-containing protein [Sulfurospirillum arcachonense]
MKKIFLALITLSTLVFSFDFGSLINSAEKVLAPKQETSTKQTTSSSPSTLQNSTITSGLKEALNVGVDYAIKELGKDNGYLNSAIAKIPLPENLAKAEGLIRKAGGEKVADDLINSMNKAASNAAPKTATIFAKAITNMNIDDAKNILAGDDKAATKYFQKNTSTSLKQIITPIIQESMKENSVAKYYQIFNDTYRTYGKDLVESTDIMKFAKQFGANKFLPSSSDENLDDYITNKAIEGLFKMIAQKEADIRKNPVAQTTSLLKQVFGD